MLSRSLYIFSAKMVGYGIRLILPVILVRLLSKEDFGAYRQFFLMEVMIATAFQFGVNQALYYFIPRDEENAGAYYLNSILLNFAIYAVVFTGIGLWAPAIAERLKMPLLASHFWHLVLFTLALMLIASTDCYLTARQRIKQSAFFEIGGQVIVSIVTIVVAFASRQLGSIITALVLARVVHLLAMAGYVQVRLRGFRARRYFRNLWPQVRYGVVLGLGGTFWTLLMRLHEMLVSSRYGPEVYAVYSAGCTHIPFMHMFFQSLAVVSLGRFAAMEKAGDREGIRRLWKQVLVSLFGAALPITAFLLLIAKPLILAMFTPAYAEAVGIFRINTLVRLSLLWNATLVLRAMGRNDVTFWVHGGLLLAAPIVLTMAMDSFGLLGAISAQLLLQFAGRLLSLFILNRISGLALPYITTPQELVILYRHTAATAWNYLSQARLHRRKTSIGPSSEDTDNAGNS